MHDKVQLSTALRGWPVGGSCLYKLTNMNLITVGIIRYAAFLINMLNYIWCLVLQLSVWPPQQGIGLEISQEIDVEISKGIAVP